MIDGAEFKRRREAIGISQRELAERINTTQNVISRAETGVKDLSVGMLATAAFVLGCTVDDLLNCRDALAENKKVVERRAYQKAYREKAKAEETS